MGQLDRTALLIARQVKDSLPRDLLHQLEVRRTRHGYRPTLGVPHRPDERIGEQHKCTNCLFGRFQGKGGVCLLFLSERIEATISEGHVCDAWRKEPAKFEELAEECQGVSSELEGDVNSVAAAPGPTGGSSKFGLEFGAYDEKPEGAEGAAPIKDQIATDDKRAEQLLRSAQKEGEKRIGSVTASALSRLLERGPEAAVQATSLYDETELDALADSLAKTNATGELLGKTRIRMKPGIKTAEKFSDKAVHPMAPLAAIKFFSKLVPVLHSNMDKVDRWVSDVRGNAFSLALDTDKVVLDKVKEAIRERLANGKTTSGPAAVQEILREAGITETVGGQKAGEPYAKMVFRTNAMTAYNRGAQEEMRDPDVAEAFPVWQYLGADDHRQGADHAVHNGKYFPAAVTFESVRDRYVVGKNGELEPSTNGKGRPFNCRCSFIPISAARWRKLLAQGARLEA